MKTIKECTNEMIRQFKMLQWEGTIEGDAIAIVKECIGRLSSDQRLPEYIDPLVWEHFKQHRVTIKKKMTPHAEELMIKALSRARGDGVDPNRFVASATIAATGVSASVATTSALGHTYASADTIDLLISVDDPANAKLRVWAICSDIKPVGNTTDNSTWA